MRKLFIANVNSITNAVAIAIGRPGREMSLEMLDPAVIFMLSVVSVWREQWNVLQARIMAEDRGPLGR